MKVLIIEDDNIFGDMVSLYLAEEDFIVQRASTGQEGLLTFQTFAPDAILLDLTLPDMDGIELCGILREQTCMPIIIVSMNSKVSEKIKALTAGADDYISKPFSMQELKARILTATRKSTIVGEHTQTVGIQQPVAHPYPHIRFDMERRAIYIHDELIETTYSEFEILKIFNKHPEKVFSRDDLINAIRGISSYVNERSIDVHVRNLRKKIEINPKHPKYIITVWGIGYKFSYA
jgi:two-component system response regulator RegX3